ncbi:unnamed protein product [Cladocopium goreaui]|uniref:Uncharacterized protein n=1 Tax=Cladocopium goreaui TaxID=2562237 RepID=A0A9P1DAN3_9DINO|nr:unnamed protein product [Cladocopium goreaui]
MGNSTASRTIFLDGESGDEMSESDDGAGTVVDGPASLPRKTKKKRRYKQKTVPAAAGEEHDEDDGYEPSIREEGPDEEDARIDEKGKITNRVELQEEEFNCMMDEMNVKLDTEKSDEVEVVGEPPERDVIIRRGQLEAEAEKLKEIKLKKEKEKKAKAEAAEKNSSHKDPPKDGSRKKKKKSNKESKESSGKDGSKDAAAGVGTLRGDWEVEPCQGSWRSGMPNGDP